MQLCLLPVQLFSLPSKLGTALNLAARLLLNVVLEKAGRACRALLCWGTAAGCVCQPT